MMSVDDSLMCSFQVLKPAEKKPTSMFGPGGIAAQLRPNTPPLTKVYKSALFFATIIGLTYDFL